MPVTPTYPGVYVQEVPSGVRTIVGVGTSTGMFIGASKKGPMSKPIRCTNYSAFRDTFGEDSTAGELAQYVKLFFLNGGTDTYVMRIAQGAQPSSVTLLSETGRNALRLIAKDPGLLGESIRAVVTYSGPQPEVTFNLEVFRFETDATGKRVKKEGEVWRNLSMDPASPTYAQTFLSQNSKLVNAVDLIAAPGMALGYSFSGRFVPDAPDGAGANGFLNAWSLLLGSTANTNLFNISVAGQRYVNVDLSGFQVTDTPNDLLDAIKNAIEGRYFREGILGVTVNVTLEASNAGRRLNIACIGASGDVFIRPGTPQNGQRDLAVPLMLGTEQGGVEISGFADHRPAPNGITFRVTPANTGALGVLWQGQVGEITLQSVHQLPNIPPQLVMQIISLLPLSSPSVVTVNPTTRFAIDAVSNSPNGNGDGIREKFAIIAARINAFTPPPNHVWHWRAEVWGSRLAILSTDAAEDNLQSVGFSLTTNTPLPVAPPPPVLEQTLPAQAFTNNVHLYSVGTSGVGAFQLPGATGSDGIAPLASDYENAYRIIDKEVDLFNLMILPSVAGALGPVQDLYGNASVFCQERRAFLVMDPPDAWINAQTATTGISTLRTGLVKDHSAVFFPRLTVDVAGLRRDIGPAGAIAGLFARIDGTRGVWKAPAGTEADLRGIAGLQQAFSDRENGTLNPKAINTLRIFPNGIVNWGARTNDGSDDNQSEYKYIPIRRLALFMEESLYRGLKWAVFEPNGEPLWAQIRLNVGAFMHNLFRQGAFKGTTPRDAYFVKCDSETTTQNDRNLGIVNVWVGFAPLKPAEFVILSIQQMAGQIET